MLLEGFRDIFFSLFGINKRQWRLHCSLNFPSATGTNVGTSATGALSRKDMIATLKDTWKALEEKKLRLEAVIAGLELEEERDQPEDNAELDDEEAGDSTEEDTEGSEDI
jgi:hypothetical protein